MFLLGLVLGLFGTCVIIIGAFNWIYKRERQRYIDSGYLGSIDLTKAEYKRLEKFASDLIKDVDADAVHVNESTADHVTEVKEKAESKGFENKSDYVDYRMKLNGYDISQIRHIQRYAVEHDDYEAAEACKDEIKYKQNVSSTERK